MKKVKIGVIGFGGMGQLHTTNCLLMKDVEVAVADTSSGAQLKAKKMGIKEVYGDYRELIQKPTLNAVIITLPNFLHEESVGLAAEEGLDVFVEKPLGRTVQECQNIIQSTKKNGVKIMVGFAQRFLKRNQILKNVIDNGELGTVELAAYQMISGGPFSHRFPPSPVPEWWFDRKKVGGGALLDTGCHMIDLLRWLLSDEMSVQNVILGYKLRLPMEDTAILSVRFKKGTIAVLMVSWLSMAHHPVMKIDLHGTASSISSDSSAEQDIRKIAWTMSRNLARRLLKKEIEPYSAADNPYYKELRHFIDCIHQNKETSVTGIDGLECARVIDAAYRLVETGAMK